MSELVTSETQQPTNAPGWVDHWERGLDPWHADAFVGTPAEGRFENTGKRSTGWDAIDWVGNVVGFVPDGTPVDAPKRAAGYMGDVNGAGCDPDVQ